MDAIATLLSFALFCRRPLHLNTSLHSGGAESEQKSNQNLLKFCARGLVALTRTSQYRIVPPGTSWRARALRRLRRTS